MSGPMKSERLKKLEKELRDLEQWMKLGLVPKSDEAKHQEEIQHMKEKVEEEKGRLQFLKENGDMEEYITPKKQANRPGYQSGDMASMPDEMEFGGSDNNNDSYSNSSDDDNTEAENTVIEERDDDQPEETQTEVEDEEESFFSERSPWRSEGIIDPDANDW